MLLIYALLISISIIFGSRTKNKVMGQQVYICSRCNRQSYHTIVRTHRWFTLYFIPIAPVGKATSSRCNLCGYQESISNEQADAWFPKMQSNPVPQTLQAPQQTPQQLVDEGLALARAGRYMEAIASFDQAIQQMPSNPQAYYYKGEALCSIGRYQEAILDFDRAIQIAPQVPHAYYSKGRALERLGRVTEAQNVYAAAQYLGRQA